MVTDHLSGSEVEIDVCLWVLKMGTVIVEHVACKISMRFDVIERSDALSEIRTAS